MGRMTFDRRELSCKDFVCICHANGKESGIPAAVIAYDKLRIAN